MKTLVFGFTLLLSLSAAASSTQVKIEKYTLMFQNGQITTQDYMDFVSLLNPSIPQNVKESTYNERMERFEDLAEEGMISEQELIELKNALDSSIRREKEAP